MQAKMRGLGFASKGGTRAGWAGKGNPSLCSSPFETTILKAKSPSASILSYGRTNRGQGLRCGATGQQPCLQSELEGIVVMGPRMPLSLHGAAVAPCRLANGD